MSTSFKCPNCSTSLEKPAQLYVQGEINKSPKAYSVSFGGPNLSKLPCPQCGFSILAQDIVDGKHDPHASPPMSTETANRIAMVFWTGAALVIGSIIWVNVR